MSSIMGCNIPDHYKKFMGSFFSIISSSHLCSADKNENSLLSFFAVFSMTAAFYCKHDKVHHFPCHSYHIGRNPPQVHHSYLTIKIVFCIAISSWNNQGRTGFESFWGNHNCLLAHRNILQEVQKYTSVEKYSTEGVKKLFQFGTLST